MPHIERSDERIVIDADFRDKERTKAVPGVRWDADQRTWWCPLSWAACVQLRGVFSTELTVGPELGAWARNERAVRVDPCLALRVAEDSPDLDFFTALYAYQRAGADFMLTGRSVLNADEMGTGKTVQTIAALELAADAYPALIVCPNSMKYTWAAEYERWAPGRSVAVIHGTPTKKRKTIEVLAAGEADVGFINYEALRLHSRIAGYPSLKLDEKDKEEKELNAIDWCSVVADEAHRAKDPTTKQTRALWWLGRSAKRRIALTGTPIANSLVDLWALMHFVAPDEYPAKGKFIDRYALQSYNFLGFMEVIGVNPATQAEFFQILDPRFIRRTKKAVLPQLPEKTYSTRTVELGTKQRKAYNDLRKEMLAQLESGILLAADPLVRALRLNQFASAYGDIQPDDSLLLTEPSCKVDALEELVEELGEQQAVVFAESRQLIELAAARLAKLKVKFGQVTGTVGAAARQANVDAFQRGDLQFLLLTLGAGGEGLTLHAASVAVFLQRSWSAVKNAQAEDRVHRIGQTAGSVQIIDIIARDTIEQRVRSVLEQKGEQLQEIARDAATLKEWLAK